MVVNVIYMGYQPYFLEMAKELSKENWLPIYWCAAPDIEDKVRMLYPEAIYHNNFDAIKGVMPSEYANKHLEPLCPKLLEKMACVERTVLRMLERNDSHTNNFSYRERVNLYRELVQYWITVIKDLDPQYVVFEQEPHQASDYVLYEICQVMNVETIMFIETKFSELIYPVHRYEEGSKIIREAYELNLSYKKEEKVLLSNYLAEYFKRVRGCYENAIELHLYDQIEEVKGIVSTASRRLSMVESFFLKFRSLLRALDVKTRWKLLTCKPGVLFSSDQKQKSKSFKNSKLKYVEHLFYKSKTLWKKRSLKRIYRTISSDSVDLSGSYVFCALHYQPEKTTCPLGGDFDDQLFLVKTLSTALPEGWSLYVKEHPSQFVSSYTRYGEHYRSREYYTEMAGIPNVVLVPMESDTYEIIDNANAVATITGTSAWEALVRGKPALLFGFSWFKLCNGVFNVYSHESVVEALKEIANGYKVIASEVEIFASTVEEHSFRGVIGGVGIRKYFDVSDTENGIAHADAVRALITPKR